MTEKNSEQQQLLCKADLYVENSAVEDYVPIRCVPFYPDFWDWNKTQSYLLLSTKAGKFRTREKNNN